MLPKFRSVAESKRFQPAHGREGGISLRELDEYHTSRTRDRLGYIALGAALGATFLAAVYGVTTGDFGGLKDVWAAAGPIVGAVLGYYFHRSRKD